MRHRMRSRAMLEIVRPAPCLSVLLVLACGRGEPAAAPTPSTIEAPTPAAPESAPQTAAAAPAVAAPVAVVPPPSEAVPPSEPALPSEPTTAAADETIASKLLAPLPDGPIAAFVIAGSDSTVVVPVDPAIAPLRVAGIWVLDDATTPAKVSFHAGDGPAIPDCECEHPNPCDDTVRHANGTGPICSCRASRPSAYDDEEANDEDGDEDCDASDPAVLTSLVGGMLYTQSDTHDTCGGRNIYGEDWGVLEMVASAAVPSEKGLKPRGCDSNTSPGSGLFDPIPESPNCEPRQTEGDCEVCGPGFSADLEVFLIEKGELIHVEEDADTVGGAVRRWSTRTVTPKSCPSPNDTCGSTKAFPQVREADGFWVANDGTHALTQQADGALAIVSASGSTPRGKFGEGPLGVRYHADARTLITTMIAQAPSGAGTCEGGDGDAPKLSWGTQCVQHMRADRLDDARAACERGLAETTKPAARGALLYNLGVIAQRSGDTATARKHFEASLTARPGNAAVRKALAALGPG